MLNIIANCYDGTLLCQWSHCTSNQQHMVQDFSCTWPSDAKDRCLVCVQNSHSVKVSPTGVSKMLQYILEIYST